MSADDVLASPSGQAASPADLSPASGSSRSSIPDAVALVAECARFLKPGETPMQRIERDHEDILSLMKMLQREKEKNENLVQTVREFCRHETGDAYRMRVGIANIRDMLKRSRAVSNAHKRELDVELLRLLSTNNDPAQAMSASGQDPQGLEAKPASAVRTDAPETTQETTHGQG